MKKITSLPVGLLERRADRIAEHFCDFGKLRSPVDDADILQAAFWEPVRDSLRRGDTIICRFADGRPDLVLSVDDDFCGITKKDQVREAPSKPDGREHFVICRVDQSVSHRFCLVRWRGGVPAPVSGISSNFESIVRDVVGEFSADRATARSGRNAADWPNITITIRDVESVSATMAPVSNPAVGPRVLPASRLTIFAPEGGIRADRWGIIQRDGLRLYDLGTPFIGTRLGDAALDYFGAGDSCIVGQGQKFKEFAGRREPGSELWIRPAWSAARLLGKEEPSPKPSASSDALGIMGLPNRPFSYQELNTIALVFKSAEALRSDVVAATMLTEALGFEISQLGAANLRVRARQKTLNAKDIKQATIRKGQEIDRRTREETDKANTRVERIGRGEPVHQTGVEWRDRLVEGIRRKQEGV